MGFKIETITAFIAVDPRDGDEGIIGLPVPGSAAMSMPAIAADGTRAMAIYPMVRQYCEAMGVKYRIIRMSTRADVTEDFEKMFDGVTDLKKDYE